MMAEQRALLQEMQTELAGIRSGLQSMQSILSKSRPQASKITVAEFVVPEDNSMVWVDDSSESAGGHNQEQQASDYYKSSGTEVVMIEKYVDESMIQPILEMPKATLKIDIQEVGEDISLVDQIVDASNVDSVVSLNSSLDPSSSSMARVSFNRIQGDILEKKSVDDMFDKDLPSVVASATVIGIHINNIVDSSGDQFGIINVFKVFSQIVRNDWTFSFRDKSIGGVLVFVVVGGGMHHVCFDPGISQTQLCVSEDVGVGYNFLSLMVSLVDIDIKYTAKMNHYQLALFQIQESIIINITQIGSLCQNSKRSNVAMVEGTLCKAQSSPRPVLSLMKNIISIGCFLVMALTSATTMNIFDVMQAIIKATCQGNMVMQGFMRFLLLRIFHSSVSLYDWSVLKLDLGKTCKASCCPLFTSDNHWPSLEAVVMYYNENVFNGRSKILELGDHIIFHLKVPTIPIVSVRDTLSSDIIFCGGKVKALYWLQIFYCQKSVLLNNLGFCHISILWFSCIACWNAGLWRHQPSYEGLAIIHPPGILLVFSKHIPVDMQEEKLTLIDVLNSSWFRDSVWRPPPEYDKAYTIQIYTMTVRSFPSLIVFCFSFGDNEIGSTILAIKTEVAVRSVMPSESKKQQSGRNECQRYAVRQFKVFFLRLILAISSGVCQKCYAGAVVTTQPCMKSLASSERQGVRNSGKQYRGLTTTEFNFALLHGKTIKVIFFHGPTSISIGTGSIFTASVTIYVSASFYSHHKSWEWVQLMHEQDCQYDNLVLQHDIFSCYHASMHKKGKNSSELCCPLLIFDKKFLSFEVHFNAYGEKAFSGQSEICRQFPKFYQQYTKAYQQEFKSLVSSGRLPPKVLFFSMNTRRHCTDVTFFLAYEGLGNTEFQYTPRHEKPSSITSGSSKTFPVQYSLFVSRYSGFLGPSQRTLPEYDKWYNVKTNWQPFSDFTSENNNQQGPVQIVAGKFEFGYMKEVLSKFRKLNGGLFSCIIVGRLGEGDSVLCCVLSSLFDYLSPFVAFINRLPPREVRGILKQQRQHQYGLNKISGRSVRFLLRKLIAWRLHSTMSVYLMEGVLFTSGSCDAKLYISRIMIVRTMSQHTVGNSSFKSCHVPSFLNSGTLQMLSVIVFGSAISYYYDKIIVSARLVAVDNKWLQTTALRLLLVSVDFFWYCQKTYWCSK